MSVTTPARTHVDIAAGRDEVALRRAVLEALRLRRTDVEDLPIAGAARTPRPPRSSGARPKA